MWRPACLIIHTGVRSTFSPRAARISRGSLADVDPDDASFLVASSTALLTTVEARPSLPTIVKALSHSRSERKITAAAVNFMVQHLCLSNWNVPRQSDFEDSNMNCTLRVGIFGSSCFSLQSSPVHAQTTHFTQVQLGFLPALIPPGREGRICEHSSHYFYCGTDYQYRLFGARNSLLT